MAVQLEFNFGDPIYHWFCRTCDYEWDSIESAHGLRCVNCGNYGEIHHLKGWTKVEGAEEFK